MWIDHETQSVAEGKSNGEHCLGEEGYRSGELLWTDSEDVPGDDARVQSDDHSDEDSAQEQGYEGEVETLDHDTENSKQVQDHHEEPVPYFLQQLLHKESAYLSLKLCTNDGPEGYRWGDYWDIDVGLVVGEIVGVGE